MSVADAKPEPIRVGVEGIAPKPIELTPERPHIDWAHLFSLPPFQMYAIEKARKAPAGVMAWMPDWARSHESEQALFDDYCDWHAAKGCWPNETPLGEIKE